MRKCTLDQEEGEGLAFSFGHFSDAWYYLSNFVVGESTKLPKVRETESLVGKNTPGHSLFSSFMGQTIHVQRGMPLHSPFALIHVLVVVYLQYVIRRLLHTFFLRLSHSVW